MRYNWLPGDWHTKEPQPVTEERIEFLSQNGEVTIVGDVESGEWLIYEGYNPVKDAGLM